MFISQFISEARLKTIDSIPVYMPLCLSTLDLQAKSGFLEMKIKNNWKIKWFVLKDGILFEFNDKQLEKGIRHLLCNCVLSENPEDSSSFILKFTSGKKTSTLYLRTEDQILLAEWSSAILKQRLFISTAFEYYGFHVHQCLFLSNKEHFKFE